MKNETSAGAILYQNAKEPMYLLLHYGAGHWDFPKGHIEEGETEIDTVKREVKEETSIDNISIIKGFRKKMSYKFQSNGDLVSKVVWFYLARTNSRQVKLSFEHQGYEWLSYDQALERLTFRNAKQLLVKANVYLNRNQS